MVKVSAVGGGVFVVADGDLFGESECGGWWGICGGGRRFVW